MSLLELSETCAFSIEFCQPMKCGCFTAVDMGRELNETPFMKKILTSLAIATSLLSAEAQTNQTNGQPAVQLAWNPITSLDSHGNPVQTAGASYTLSWGTNSGQYMWTAQTTNAFQPVSNLLRGVRSEEHTSELQSLRHLVC